MRLLILGGTIFLGRHLVTEALARGHEVTLFNRGQHNPELFPDVEKLRGSRDGGLAALDGRRWDAAVDTCGYFPRVVRQSAERLAGAVEHYTFISSISVYPDMSPPGIDEYAPVSTLADPTVEQITGETYGALKALCEQAAEAALPGRVLNVRSGLIVGPYDPSDRFTYWPARVAAGGEVLAPGRPGDPTQLIDARDQAAWLLDAIERRVTGIFNVTGPAAPLTIGQLLDECRAVAGGDARFTWASEEFLLANEVAPFMEMPCWVPAAEAGLQSVDVRKALAAGLKFRPLADTIRDTLAWDRTRPPGERRAGMKPEREAELLAKWHS